MEQIVYATKNSLNWEALPETIQKLILEVFRITPSYGVHQISKDNDIS